MSSPLLPRDRPDGGRPRPATGPRLAMGAVTLTALVAAAWVGAVLLLQSGAVSCRLFTEDLANLRCNRTAGRLDGLSPALVLALLLPPAAGTVLGWWRRDSWGFTALAAALALAGLVGCALLWGSLTAPGPPL